jgi:hypothetical protein
VGGVLSCTTKYVLVSFIDIIKFYHVFDNYYLRCIEKLAKNDGHKITLKSYPIVLPLN